MGAAEYDGVVRPCCGLGEGDLGDDDGPGKKPEDIGAETLVKVPARHGCEKNSGKLVREGKKDKGPVDVLSWGNGQRNGKSHEEWMEKTTNLPHLLCDFSNHFRSR
jgi:hypothetical protein